MRMGPRRIAATIAAVLIATTVGCGDSGGSPLAGGAGTTAADTPSADLTSGEPSTSGEPTTASSSPSSSVISTTPTTPVAGTSVPTQTVTELTQFSTPSGNIGCGIDPTYVRCDVLQHTWHAPPPGPGECTDGDWGTAIALSTREAGFICVSDTVAGSSDHLEYGTAIQSGPFRCTSETAGLRCERVGTTHAFFVSRERYQLS
jgi:hypothetical protein